MKIFSGFHDYYDIGLKYGIDPNCKYIRKTEEIPYKDARCRKVETVIKSIVEERPEYYRSIDYYHYIVFCGRLFFCVELSECLNYKSYHTFLYNYKDLNTYAKKHNNKYLNAELAIDRDRHNFHLHKTVKETFETVSKMKEKDERLIQLSMDFKTPIIIFEINSGCMHNPGVLLNGNLGKRSFYKVMDPVTAFQELSMFISGVMGGQAPPMIKVSDEIRLEKHGFDKKDSFRNTKGRLK